MQNIIPLDFIDVSQMTAALLMKHAVHFGDDKRRQSYPGSAHHDTETILLRGPEGLLPELAITWTPDQVKQTWQADVPHADWPLLETWPSARKVLDAIGSSHALRAGGAYPQFGKVMIVKLKAGGVVDWHVDEGSYAEAHDRFHVCMVPTPGAWLYSGGQGAILQVGALTFFNNRVLHCAANFAGNPRVHLIVDIRKPVLQ